MKKFLLPLLLLPGFLFAANGDTTFVRFHNKVDMNNHGAYDVKGKFPDGSKTYRQILMKYTLGCSSTGCSGWDYTNYLQYLRPTGLFDSSVASIDTTGGKHDTIWKKTERKEPFELGRVITPYGTYMQAPGSNGYTPAWTHPYLFDVTDFVLLLKDSATIRSYYDGWSAGFSATIDFYFIEGTPPRNVLKIENVYGNGGSGFGFGNPANFEKTATPKKGIAILPGAKSASFQFTPSGHGFDNDLYAAEFYDEHAAVELNGTKIGDMRIWRDDCGKNPIYPQGGTWIYNRANWCPGSKVNTFSYTIGGALLHAGTTDSIDVNFDPYTYTGNGGASYIISSVFVQYGDNNFLNDATLSDIITPSTNDNYRRLNPICYGPTLELKNNGKTTLTSCVIQYGLSTGPKSAYTWNGNLPFNQSTQVTLPSFNWAGAVNGSIFEAEISLVNSVTDEWTHDNKMQSALTIPPKHDVDLVIWLKTNNRPEENSYKVLDWMNNVVYQKSGLTKPNFIYKDTVRLAVGCYTFLEDDSGGDGLSWWANTAAGSGYTYFRNMNGSTVKNFNADFGSEIRYNFTTAYTLGLTNPLPENEDILVFPNPSSKDITIQLGNALNGARIILMDMTGKTYYERSGIDATESIEVTGMPKGIYLLKVVSSGKVHTQKVIVE